MPYASPSVSLVAVAAALQHPQPSSSTRVNRAGGHRRSQSLSSDIVDLKNSSSAFNPLFGVPRRTRSNGNVKRPPMFHLVSGEDENSSGDNNINNKDSPGALPSPPEEVNGLGLTVNGQGLRVDVTNLLGLDNPADESESVPFPCISSPRDESSQAPSSVLLQQSEDGIHSSSQSPKSPIIRKSNGQVLKPSLKSSLSSGNIPSLGTPQGNGPRAFTRSAPTTPSLKAVHFADKDGVVVFEKSQRPTAVSLGSTAGDDTETETERDIESGPAYPFPVMPPSSGSSCSQLVISSSSSPIPSSPVSHILASDDMVRLESVTFVGVPAPALRGSILVQNVSFEKTVSVRFTVDDWQTTSEVAASYVSSVSQGLTQYSRSKSLPVLGRESGYSQISNPREWDRFEFTIKLEDVRNLEQRRLYLVVRYVAAEWNWAEFWDNNFGKNFYIGFERAQDVSSKPISPPTAVSERVKAMEAFKRTNPLPSFPPLKTQSLISLPTYRASSPVPTRAAHIRSQSASYPTHHLSLKNYVSPKAPQPSVPKPSESDRGPAPISPPESPVTPLRMIQGQPALKLEDAALSQSQSPADLPHTSTPAESVLPFRERKLALVNDVKTITPPESKEHSPDMVNIPLPLSPSSSDEDETTEDDSETDSEPVAPASDGELAAGSTMDPVAADHSGSKGEQLRSPSYHVVPRSPPKASSVPRALSPSRPDGALSRSSQHLANNAPPEFLQRFCFFGSPSQSLNGSPVQSPTQASPPTMVLGGEPIGGATMRRGMWDMTGFSEHVSMMRA